MRRKILGKILYLITGIIFASAGCDFKDIIGGRDNPDDPWGDNYHVTMKGFVQKGPFCSGSTITIQGMNSSFQPDGEIIQTTTLNDTGGFSIEVAFHTKIVEVSVSGYYFNEVTGYLSESPLVLKSLVDLTTITDTNVNINVLTTLGVERIKYLCGTGISFADAKARAEGETLSVFGIPSANVSDFNRMDISSNSGSNAILLAVSSILQQNNSVAQMSELISQTGLDISGDGTLDSTSLITKLLVRSAAVDPEQVRENLLSRYTYLGLQNLTIPEFDDYIDSDGDGLINIRDFVISFIPVIDVNVNTDITSNEITIVLPEEISEATAAVDSGTVVKNGSDTGTASVTVANGDKVAMKVKSSAGLLTSLVARMDVMYGSFINSGYFQVTTQAYTDEDCVKMDKDALQIGYINGDSASRVMNNITLLTEGANKTAISWSSSNTDVVSDAGAVTRPLREEGDASVTLTATIKRGEISDSKVFTITVKHGHYIYASTLAGLYISMDDGRNWKHFGVETGMSSPIFNDLYIIGSNIYGATVNLTSVNESFLGGVSISTDNGEHWVNYTTVNGLGGNYGNGIFVDGSIIYAATDGGVSISADNGVNWVNYTTANGLGSNGVGDVFAVGSTLYAATDGGVSISTDNGVHWTIYTTADGLASNNVRDISISGSTVYVLTDGGISISTDSGVHYTTLYSPGFPSVGVMGFCILDSTIYMATWGGGIWVSTDNGINWTSFKPDPSGGAGSNANILGRVFVQ